MTKMESKSNLYEESTNGGNHCVQNFVVYYVYDSYGNSAKFQLNT